MLFSRLRLNNAVTGILAAVLILGSLATAVALSSPLITYSASAISVGAGIYTVYALTPKGGFGLDSQTVLHTLHRRTRLIDSVILGIIALIPVCFRLVPSGVPDAIYVLVLFAVSLIAGRILGGTPTVGMPLLQILLLTLTFRAALWFSFPVYGQDSLRHTAIASYITTTGDPFLSAISESASYLSYYADYPGGNLFVAVGILVTDVSSKVGYFLMAGGAYVLAIVAVYLFTERILGAVLEPEQPQSIKDRTRRAALLATLLFAFSAGPLQRGSELYAQTVAEALLAFCLVPIVRQLNQELSLRMWGVLLTIFVTMLITHTLAPLVFAGILLLVSGAKWISRWIDWVIDFVSRWSKKQNGSPTGSTSSDRASLPSSSRATLSIAAMATVYLWIVIELIRAQVMRAIGILSISTNTGSEAIASTNAGSPPTVSLWGMEPPGILVWAGPLLALAVVTTFVGFVLLSQLVRRASRYRGNQEQKNAFSAGWLYFSLLLFGAYAVFYAIGGQGPVIRALDGVTLLMVPVLGFTIDRLRRLDVSPIRVTLVAFVVSSVVLSGVFSPMVAMPNRDDESFSPRATAQEVAAVDFVSQRYTDGEVAADGYLRAYSYLAVLAGGQNPHTPFTAVLSNSKPTESRNEYQATINSTMLVLYRDTYKDYYDIDKPNRANQIFSTGNVSIHH